jgi:hypothetical protein
MLCDQLGAGRPGGTFLLDSDLTPLTPQCVMMRIWMPSVAVPPSLRFFSTRRILRQISANAIFLGTGRG